MLSLGGDWSTGCREGCRVSLCELDGRPCKPASGRAVPQPAPSRSSASAHARASTSGVALVTSRTSRFRWSCTTAACADPLPGVLVEGAHGGEVKAAQDLSGGRDRSTVHFEEHRPGRHVRPDLDQ